MGYFQEVSRSLKRRTKNRVPVDEGWRNARESKPMRHCFDRFVVDDQSGLETLYDGDTISPLQQKHVQVLVVLVRHAGVTMSKDAIMSAVWGDDEIAEQSLYEAIGQIRKALGEGDGRRYIRNIRGKGYCFVCKEIRVGSPKAEGQSDHDIEAAGHPRLESAHNIDQEVLDICWRDLYQWKSAVAHAVRLVGAQDQHFPLDRIAVSFDRQPYEVPARLQLERKKLLEAAKRKAREAGTDIWDGPCVRLCSYLASPVDESEQTHLQLTLGKITWFDYVVANQRFGDDDISKVLSKTYSVREFVDFERLVNKHDVSASQLSNILTPYLTATTSDGFLMWSKRSGFVGSHPHLSISATSENVHREKDGVWLEPVKALFKAAGRGIEEELSPSLAPPSPATDILLLGLEFHLQAYHPGLLFYLPLVETRAEVQKALREDRGIHYFEGRAQFVHLDDLAALERLLGADNWIAPGKASAIRTLEYLTARGRSSSRSMAQSASELADKRRK